MQTNEPVNDLPFRVGGSGQNAQSVIAAIGPLNSRREVNKHNIRDHSTYDQKIDFSATVKKIYKLYSSLFVNEHRCICLTNQISI